MKFSMLMRTRFYQTHPKRYANMFMISTLVAGASYLYSSFVESAREPFKHSEKYYTIKTSRDIAAIRESIHAKRFGLPQTETLETSAH